MSKVLVTGGAGFIGSHIIDHLYENTDWDLILLDRLSYAGSLDRLAKYRNDSRVKFYFHDFRAALSDSLINKLGKIDVIIHSGAETHVGNSLKDPEPFVQSNVLGTFNMLEASRKLRPKYFVMVSTDEVFGAAPLGVDYKEDDSFNPTNPYSGTKAAAECLAKSWAVSYQVPLILTRTMNNFGERQHCEKFVPMVMRKVIKGETVVIHVDKQGNPGARKWLHARNHADAILHLLKNGLVGTWHIPGVEVNNLEIAQIIADCIGKELKYELVDFHSFHPGHDLRYSLDGQKIEKTFWYPKLKFDEAMKETIKWTLEHKEWINA